MTGGGKRKVQRQMSESTANSIESKYCKIARICLGNGSFKQIFCKKNPTNLLKRV